MIFFIYVFFTFINRFQIVSYIDDKKLIILNTNKFYQSFRESISRFLSDLCFFQSTSGKRRIVDFLFTNKSTSSNMKVCFS